jgi:putative pre-16S rRNA nuclease
VTTPGRLLCVDWGERRIGLALSDEAQILAQPLTTLTRRAGKRVPVQAIADLAAQHQVVGVVVGLPLDAQGDSGPAAAAARDLAAKLASRTNLPVDLWDERMSTARAHGAVREQAGSTKGRKGDVDTLAAQIILQHYLDTRRGTAL